MQIKLKPAQVQIFTNIQAAKQALQEEFNKLAARESELATVIVESHNGSLTQEIVLDVKASTITCLREGEELIEKYIEQLPQPKE